MICTFLQTITMRILSYSLLAFAFFFVTGCQSMSPATAIPLKNSSFEGAAMNKNIPDWDNEEHAGKWNGNAYEMTIDSGAGPEGGHALRVTQLHKEVYGFVHQKVPVGADVTGKTLLFSAMVRSNTVGANGWMLVVNMKSTSGILGQFKTMPVIGTTDWHKVEATAIIPKGTAFVDFGFLLRDSGTGWAANPTLSIK
jgi:hypothetical protein